MNSNEHTSGASKDMECAGLPAPCSPKLASANDAVPEASLGEQSGSKLPHSKLFYGPQPLDKIMEELGIKNHDLVAASTEGLTHKQVNKGRKGRRLTRNVRDKIIVSIGTSTGNSYSNPDLFTYN